MMTEEEFFEQIEEKRKTDPLIGAKLGAQYIYKRLYDSLIDPNNRINMTEFLLWGSGLTGMSCQMAVRESLKKGDDVPQMALVPVDCKNGSRIFIGEGINHYLFESEMPVWNFIMATYLKLNPEADLPDINETVETSLKNATNEEYKVWGMEYPKNLLGLYRKIWFNFEPAIRRYCPQESEWPILYVLVLQMIIEEAAKVIDLSIVVNKAIENLLVSSKLDYSSNAQ
ncbi:hypothetical protein [Streptococcus dentiloxodontae]